MPNIYGEVHQRLIKGNDKFKTVLEEDKFLAVKAIGDYCRGASILTNRPIEYFSRRIESIDIIRFDENDDDLLELSVKNINCRSYNFFKNNQYGIVVKAKTSSDKEYTLMHELTHFFIKTSEDENGDIYFRETSPEDSNQRLDEGITEKITQDVWDKAYPDKESLGSKESRYLMEIQIATVLMDIMGKNGFLDLILDNPKKIVDKLRSIKYQDSNLFDYLEDQMEPLVEFRGRKEDNACFDIMNSFEALSDCHKVLKLEKKNGVIR